MRGKSRKTVAIVQSSYIPWKGYFDLIQQADEFVLLDDVQFTKRDWRNRNRIKTFQGLQWLTIPVRSIPGERPKICEVEIEGSEWTEKHWASIIHNYSRARFFGDYRDHLERLYESARNDRSLSRVNYRFLTALMEILEIRTKLSWSTDYPGHDDASKRLLGICSDSGADIYLSGPSAREYLDGELFRNSGIEVRFMDYSGYPEYRQLHGEFQNGVSVIDLILNEGPGARDFFRPAEGRLSE